MRYLWMGLSSGYIDQVWLFLKMKLKSFNIAFIFDLEYRYAILSRGMHYKESWNCFSVQVTHVNWERHKNHTYTFSGLTLCQNRWHRFWETGGTDFVSAGPMAICLKSPWHWVLELDGTDFHWSLQQTSSWGVGYYTLGPHYCKLLFLRLLVCFFAIPC
jgi:hypothetical protein